MSPSYISALSSSWTDTTVLIVHRLVLKVGSGILRSLTREVEGREGPQGYGPCFIIPLYRTRVVYKKLIYKYAYRFDSTEHHKG